MSTVDLFTEDTCRFAKLIVHLFLQALRHALQCRVAVFPGQRIA